MMPRVDAGTVAPVTPGAGSGAGVAVADGRQAAFQRAMQNLVGQTVSAEVMSKLKDGTYLVKVADNAVRIALPAETQVGSNVPLTVLSAQPRPTFQLGSNTPGGNPTLVYGEGDEAATLPSQNTSAPVPGQGKPASGTTAGQPGNATATPGPAAADGEALPGQVQPGTTPAQAQTAARPGLPAGAANLPDAQAALAGRPATAATPNPAAALATPAPAAGQPMPAQTAASAAAALASGNPLPADSVKPQSLAASLLGKAPLTPSHELPELGPNTLQATLSNTARVLTTVLSAPGTQSALVALVGKTALFGNADPDTTALAQKLHDTIGQSGLFYESHVAEWVKGERPLTELAREPQMQRLLQQSNESAARAASGGPDLSAAQMINQQLHTQEQQRVLWNGQAWPGQDMQWEIRRDERQGSEGRDGSGDSDGEQEPIWRSGVRFRLPLLGAVSAAVTLVGEQVHIQVQTDNEHSAGTLRAYAGELESAMAAAGAALTSLTIHQEHGHDG